MCPDFDETYPLPYKGTAGCVIGSLNPQVFHLGIVLFRTLCGVLFLPCKSFIEASGFSFILFASKLPEGQ